MRVNCPLQPSSKSHFEKWQTKQQLFPDDSSSSRAVSKITVYFSCMCPPAPALVQPCLCASSSRPGDDDGSKGFSARGRRLEHLWAIFGTRHRAGCQKLAPKNVNKTPLRCGSTTTPPAALFHRSRTPPQIPAVRNLRPSAGWGPI